MRPFYVSLISYLHGDPRPLAQLNEEMPLDLTLPEHGLATYRVSADETWQLAAKAAQPIVERSPVPPDLLVYVTETDREAVESLPKIVLALGLPRLSYVAVSGHACGNIGPALELAATALETGTRQSVLVVVADRAGESNRILANGLSVFSDGAAACLVSHAPPDGDSPNIRVRAMTTHTEVVPDSAKPSDKIMSSVRLGRDGMAAITRDGRSPADFRYVLFPNFSISSQRFLTQAMRFEEGRLLLGPLAEYGHCFSVDILVNLDILVQDGPLERGDSVLVSATGPMSWSMFDVEVV